MKACPAERTSEAPSGRAKAQSGQEAVTLPRCACSTRAATMAPVPKAIGQVSRSPSSSTPKAAPNKGVVDASALVSVGPR